jgi:hypothetical protein
MSGSGMISLFRVSELMDTFERLGFVFILIELLGAPMSEE